MLSGTSTLLFTSLSHSNEIFNSDFLKLFVSETQKSATFIIVNDVPKSKDPTRQWILKKAEDLQNCFLNRDYINSLPSKYANTYIVTDELCNGD